MGHSVSLIITHNQNEVIDNVRVIGLSKRKSRLHRMLFAPLQALTFALREKADVYHFHDPELIPAGIFLKFFTRKKIIYDVHENTAQQIMNKDYLGGLFQRRILSILLAIIENISKFFFDIIIVARPDIAEHWQSTKVRIIINAAVLTIIGSAPLPVLTKKRPAIIYAGGLTNIRGIKHLIQSMEIIGDQAELYLVGEWQCEDFRKECEQLVGWKHVRYLGYMSVEQVYGYMKQCDIGVVTFLPAPNHLTTLPNKPFEYMACNLPVVMSNFDYWKEIFHEHALFANPRSPKSIAMQIQKLLNNPKLRESLGKKGRRLVENKYSWEAESNKLLEIYDSLSGDR